MIVHHDFRHHWKTRSLVSKLKDYAAPLYVIELWAHCQRQRTTYFEMTDEQLKMVCDFQGEGSVLREAIITCGFIVSNPDKPTGFWVHNWEKYNKTLINSWVNGAKGGRRKEPMGYPQKPTGNPPKSISNSLGVQNKNKMGNPRVPEHEPTLSEEEKNLNRKRLAEFCQDLKKKLSASGTINTEETK